MPEWNPATLKTAIKTVLTRAADPAQDDFRQSLLDPVAAKAAIEAELNGDLPPDWDVRLVGFQDQDKMNETDDRHIIGFLPPVGQVPDYDTQMLCSYRVTYLPEA